MICLNLPKSLDTEAEHRVLKYLSLNGQTKTALEKSTVGGWRYDIVDQGFKANMPDLCAAVGLAQLRQYASHMLPERAVIFDTYDEAFADDPWALRPPRSTDEVTSSHHLYQLRLDGIGESERNEMMRMIGDEGLGVNVHYVPMPMLTLFKRLGYDMEDFPQSFAIYENEITLPVYNQLAISDVQRVAEAVKRAHRQVSSS